MMEGPPQDILKVIAANILRKQKGEGTMIPLTKIAADANSFLQQYNLRPEQFAGNKEVESVIDERRKKMEDQLNQFYKTQGETLGGLTPEMKTSRDATLKQIGEKANKASIVNSIQQTQRIAEKDPDGFRNMLDLSNQSEQALGKSHGREMGGAIGAFGGGLAGLAIGKRMPKRSSGLLQQMGGALGGSLAGGVIGSKAGEARDEKRTGFNHEDVVKPFEAAQKLRQRQEFGG